MNSFEFELSSSISGNEETLYSLTPVLTEEYMESLILKQEEPFENQANFFLEKEPKIRLPDAILSNISTQSTAHNSNSQQNPQLLVPPLIEQNGKTLRKYCPDGIHKKIKVSFNKYLLKKLNKHLKQTKITKKHFGKFSQEMVKDVAIKECKNQIQTPIQVLLQTDQGNKKEKNVQNKTIIEELTTIWQTLTPRFREILNSTYGELFNLCYLKSREYQDTLEKLKRKETPEYAERFSICACDFTNYYLSRNGNTRLKKTNEKRQVKKSEADS